MNTQILNRWGEVVFTSDELSPVWVGNVNGGALYSEDGLYFYRIEYENLEGQPELKEGTILILR